MICAWRVLGLVLVFSLSAHAQIKFTSQMQHFSTQDGLPSNRVMALAQDHSGYIWAATERGLVRHDGKHFAALPAIPGVPEASVETLYVDSLNRLWLGLTDHGVCAIAPDRRSAECFSAQASQHQRLPDNTVFGITEYDRQIWLAVFGYGLCTLEIQTLIMQRCEKQSNADVVSAASDAEGAYFASFSGYLIAAKNISKKTVITQHAIGFPLVSIDVSDSGIVLGLGSGNGIARFNPTHADLPVQTIALPKSRTTMSLLQKQGAILAATDVGLAIVTSQSTRLLEASFGTPNSLPEGLLTTLLVDSEGGVWIGSVGSGLSHWSAQDQRMDWLLRGVEALPSSLVNHASFDSNGSLWLALHNSGVVIARPNGHIEKLPIDATKSSNALPTRASWLAKPMRQGARDYIWIGHQTGLSHYEPTSRQFVQWSGNGLGKLVDLLIENPAGGIVMVSARQELYALDSEMRTLRHVGAEVTGGDVEQISWRAGQLWLAGYGGLRALAEQGRDTWSLARQVLPKTIYAFADCADMLWAASDKELIALDPILLQPVRRVARPPGPGSDIGGMQCYRGTLWFAGPGGLWHLRADDAQALPIEVLRGVAKTELSDRPFELREATLMIAAQSGVLRLSADIPPVSPSRFPLHLHELGSPRPLATQILLPWQNPTLQIEAHALSFSATELAQFQFQLSPGPNAPFSDSRNANLSSLLPGEYQLQVRARNGLGVAVSAPLIALTVEAPPWQRWYSKFAIALFLLLIGLWLNTWLIRRKAKRRLEFEQIQYSQQLALARTETLGYISHEMRNLLNGVTGNAELLRLTEDKTQQLKLSERIVSAGEALAQLLDDALDHTKLVLNRMALHPQRFDLAELLEDVLTIVQAHAAAKQLQLHYEFVDIEHVCVNDAGRIRQILLNLLSNAIKFTEQGGVHLFVQMQAQALTVRVSDTGTGIPAAQQQEIFKPYVRLDRATRGTGLGLAISAELARTMGGSLSLVTSPIEAQPQWTNGTSGSCFELNLPMPIAEEATSETKTSVPAMRLLVVEDGLDNQLLIKALLRSVGHEVNLASDAFAAIAVTSHTRFDAVLIDLDLPGMSGLELAAVLATQTLMQDVPMIALSGRAESMDQQACISAGMQAHVAKPYRLKKIQDALAQTLAAARQRAADLNGVSH
jgi:signal transduction histidine kinase/ligand-binding sensor domain-containing protein/ActR/RegA family two-component response regulator